MATTIQSGRASSPLLTADVASRAEVYGGRGIVFDGTSDALEAGKSNNLGTGTNLTISCWLKNSGTTRAYAVQIQKGSGSTNLTLQINGNSSSNAAGYIGAMVWNGSSHEFVNYNGSVDDGNWHHIAVTTTSSAQVVYLNGKAVATGSINFVNQFSADVISIGRAYNVNGYFFNGSMCDLKIYSSVLSESDIRNQYLKPESVPSSSNLKAWYPMCEGLAQSVAYDHSGNNNHAVEGGGSSYTLAVAQNEPLIPQAPLMKYNQKMLLDGHGSKNVLLASGIPAFGTNPFTVSAFYIPTVDSSAYDYIIHNSASNGTGGFALGVLVSSGKIIGGTWAGVGVVSDTASSVQHEPMHIVYSRTGTGSDEAHIYKNGVKIKSGTDTINYVASATARIGASGGGSQPTSGIIDELSVWNHGMIDDEVSELYANSVIKDATTHSKSANLLGYWRNDGVTTWLDRKGWSYLDFVTNDYLQTASAVDAFGTNPFSFSVWINQHSTAQQAIFSNAQWNNNQDWFFASIGSGGSGLLGLGNYSSWKHKFDTALIQTNKWHLVTYVREGTGTNQSKWYIDGALINTATEATNWKAASYLNIGSYVTSGGFIDGQISQLAIYHNKSLSASEVSEQFSNGISSKFTTSGMTHHYVMDNGTTIVDLVGSNNATNNGATYVSGNGSVQGSPEAITIREGLTSGKDGLNLPLKNPSGNVLRLNGVNEYVVAPDTDLALSEQITIECWAKNNSADLATDEYFANQYNASGNQRSWLFRMTSDEKLRVVWSSDGTNYSLTSTSSAITNVTTWRHYVVTIASGVPKLYVDGEVQTIDSLTNSSGLQTSLHNSTANIFVGKYTDNSDNNWNGIIDEVKIYNRALFPSEVSKNYKHQKGKHKND